MHLQRGSDIGSGSVRSDTAQLVTTDVPSRNSPEAPGNLVARLNPGPVESPLDPFDEGRPRGRLDSRHGSVATPVAPDPTIPGGAVRLPSHHPKTNDCTSPADLQSAEPNRNQCTARSVANGATVAVAGGGAA